MLPVEFRTPPWNDRSGRVSVLKSVTLVLLFYPAGWMLYHWQQGEWLIPQASLTYWSGVWALVVLLATLAVTPLRRILRWNRLLRIRRMLGVAALIYTVAHMIIYFWLRFWDASFILTEMATRLTLIVATVSFLGLVALGVTSFDAAIKQMGARNWDRLHRLTYIFTGLAVFHFLLSPGASAGLPFLMVGVYAWLMAWRYLAARGLGESVPALAALGAATTVLTVALEAIWPAIFFDMNPLISLGFNFSLVLGVSPGWKMLGLSAAVVLGLALVRRRRALAV